MISAFRLLRRFGGADASRVALALLCAAALTATQGCTKTDTGAEKAAAPAKENPVVVLETNKGNIEIELYPDKAPASVANFLEYVDQGQYNGTIFHRVIEGFMIQGGGFDTNHRQKPTGDPIKNEAGNGLKNERGTVAMARTSVVDSATAQFFINTVDNAFLDHKNETPQGYGYAVFGRVVGGMDVVDAIESTPTKNQGGAFANAPVEDVVIEKAHRK